MRGTAPWPDARVARVPKVPVVDGSIFEFRDVTVDGEDGPRVSGLSGSIADHGVTVVAGPSGSGKSTVMRLCNRLEAATSGEVLYRGRPIESVDPLELRREVGMVFQRPVCLPGTVAENLRAGSPHATDAEVAGLLARVGLEGLGDRDARSLSGGEVQRMALARTLLTEPEFVLFDEPTTSLDPSASKSIEDLATGLAEQGIPSVWVTHDLDQMRRLAHHVLIVIDGAVAQQGHLEDVLTDPTPAVRGFLQGGNAGGDPDDTDSREEPR